jgi:hypothetical protein
MVRTRYTRIDTSNVDTSKISAATARMREDMDKVWEEVNKVFEQAEQILSATPNTDMKAEPKLHFEAHTKKERWRMFRRFFMMSWKVLFTGQVDLTYKKRT